MSDVRNRVLRPKVKINEAAKQVQSANELDHEWVRHDSCESCSLLEGVMV
jgi:hypothetical protein